MSRLAIALGCVLISAPALRAQEQLPVAVLNDIKAATVFVKVQAGPLEMSGSGFLMLVKDDFGLIVTNEHVVTPPTLPTQRGRPARVLRPVIEVVFNSGRKTETVLKAEVVAADPFRDLAILRVRNVKDLPKPIDLAAKVELVETLPVYVFGFPFGEALSTSRGHPAITVGKGSISSVREDDRGEQKVVQIDGDLNPGNSGGPVVDGKGRLIGVAVAKLRGTHIGLAIPPAELTKMLNGRVSGVSVSTVKVADGVAEVRVQVKLIDPLNKVGKAAVRYVTGDRPPPPLKADADGHWPPLPGAETLNLKIDGQTATGTFAVKLNGKPSVRCTVQPVITNGANDVVYLQPGRPHTITATDSADATAKAPADPDAAKPAAPIVATPAKAIGDLAVKEVSIGSGAAPACLCWSADGRSFYHLDGSGVVRRIEYGTFTEQASCDTGRKCSWLSLSAEGVVVTVPDDQELRVLDPVTLKPVRKAPIAKAKRAVSSPGSRYAYAAETDPVRALLSVIDLKTGEIVKQYQAADFRKPLVGFDHLVLSADGRRLFTTSWEAVCRFAVSGPTVRFEEQSPRLIQGRFEGLCLSPDGQFVCAPCGGGNYNVEGEERGSYITYLYRADALKKSVLTLHQGAYPTAVGYDLPSGLLYGQNHESQLIVFTAKGIKLKEHNLLGGRGAGGFVKQFLVHPDGRKLLVLAEGDRRGATRLWSVELGDG
ncbi:MAG TPA: serine protease [Gemmataceae bacterium]|jgi:S1-C subfamily serine protease